MWLDFSVVRCLRHAICADLALCAPLARLQYSFVSDFVLNLVKFTTLFVFRRYSSTVADRGECFLPGCLAQHEPVACWIDATDHRWVLWISLDDGVDWCVPRARS